MAAYRRSPLVWLAGLAMVAVGCGSAGSAGSGSDAIKAADVRTITIDNFAFTPVMLQAKVGDTITVINKDSAEHSVTAADMSFDTGRFAATTKTFTASKAGRIEFMCTVHPYMTHGFIQVSP